MDRSETLKSLAEHVPFNAIEASHLASVLALVNESDIFASRYNLGGHLTASAWIESPCRTEALLLHHAGLGRWLQPGGHIEPMDQTIRDAALREATEETGLAESDLICHGLFDVDVHDIPAKPEVPAHKHYDVRFLFTAKSKDVRISAESNGFEWVGLASIFGANHSDSVIRMAQKSLIRVKE